MHEISVEDVEEDESEVKSLVAPKSDDDGNNSNINERSSPKTKYQSRGIRICLILLATVLGFGSSYLVRRIMIMRTLEVGNVGDAMNQTVLNNTNTTTYKVTPDGRNKNKRNQTKLRYSNWPNNGAKVQQIVLLGERNSGTNWITSLLASCYPDVPVNTYLSRWKHWFQDDLMDTPKIKTAVVHAVVNAYDWVEGMRRVPRQIPDHMHEVDELTGNVTLISWETFVTTPWRTERSVEDKHNPNLTEGVNIRLCQHQFSSLEVVPCLLKEHQMKRLALKRKLIFERVRLGVIREFASIWGTEQFEPPHGQAGITNPLYELKRDQSGKPYESIVNMRRDKLLNHQSVSSWDWIEGVEVAHFDKMADEEYVRSFLKRLSTHVGIDANCTNIPKPKWYSKVNLVTKEYRQWITEHVDWETEALFDYEPYPPVVKKLNNITHEGHI